MQIYWGCVILLVMNKATYLGLQQYNFPTVVVAHLGFLGVNLSLLHLSNIGIFFHQAGSPFNTTAGNKSRTSLCSEIYHKQIVIINACLHML